jgi:HK97 family phage prohead protease
MTETFPIQGWAAIYDEVDLNRDVIAPGAFRKSIAAAGAGGVKLLYQHASEKPIGRWRSFEEREKGLYAIGEIYLSTQTAREAAELIKAEIIDGLSIGFHPTRAQRANGGRRIIEAHLWEVSIVTFPMAPKARLVRASSAPKSNSIEAFAETVREAARILSA